MVDYEIVGCPYLLTKWILYHSMLFYWQCKLLNGLFCTARQKASMNLVNFKVPLSIIVKSIIAYVEGTNTSIEEDNFFFLYSSTLFLSFLVDITLVALHLKHIQEML